MLSAEIWKMVHNLHACPAMWPRQNAKSGSNIRERLLSFHHLSSNSIIADIISHLHRTCSMIELLSNYYLCSVSIVVNDLAMMFQSVSFELLSVHRSRESIDCDRAKVENLLKG